VTHSRCLVVSDPGGSGVRGRCLVVCLEAGHIPPAVCCYVRGCCLVVCLGIPETLFSCYSRADSRQSRACCLVQCAPVSLSVLYLPNQPRCSVLQRIAVCCRVLQCVAECCSVLQYVAVCCSGVQCGVLQCVTLCCSVLQCVVMQCSVVQL